MKIQLSAIAAAFLFTSAAHAQFINGSVDAAPNSSFGGVGQFTQQNGIFSIRFGNPTEIQSGTDDFASFTEGTAIGTTLSGNSSGTNAENVPDFFSFSTAPLTAIFHRARRKFLNLI
jgi:hypothetical protein